MNKIFDYYKVLNWDSFSEKNFEFVKNDILIRNPQIKKHHDLACGSGHFVFKMDEFGIRSSGSNVLDEQVAIARHRYPELDFFFNDMTNSKLDQQYDFITCNNDALNYTHSLLEWGNTFKGAYSALNEGGMFLFDFHTLEKINNSNSHSIQDFGQYCIEMTEKSIGNNFCCITSIIKKDNDIIKIFKTYHTSFSEDAVIKLLIGIGFKKIKKQENSNESRTYLLAYK